MRRAQRHKLKRRLFLLLLFFFFSFLRNRFGVLIKTATHNMFADRSAWPTRVNWINCAYTVGQKTKILSIDECLYFPLASTDPSRSTDPLTSFFSWSHVFFFRFAFSITSYRCIRWRRHMSLLASAAATYHCHILFFFALFIFRVCGMYRRRKAEQKSWTRNNSKREEKKKGEEKNPRVKSNTFWFN